jgi:hypothetical protein
MPETPPEPDLRHLFALTDDTGVFQHAVYATPNRPLGYTTDDNARGALVAARLWHRHRDPRLLRCLQTYLSALYDARPGPGQRFRNFQAFDRSWLEKPGSDDCQGRVLWALGSVVHEPPTEAVLRIAGELWRESLPLLGALEHPRGLALGILGLRYRAPGDGAAREALERAAAALDRRFAAYGHSDEWPWFQDKVSYDNGRLPQALLVAGRVLGDDALVARGLRVLEWLLEVQTAPAGHLSVIGNDGWLWRGRERPPFDQQPLEAAALVAACRAAHEATGNAVWRGEMRRCFEWYVGRNDHGLALIDPETGGCRDALVPDGLNLNQGSESTLAWLEAWLDMQAARDAGQLSFERRTEG